MNSHREFRLILQYLGFMVGVLILSEILMMYLDPIGQEIVGKLYAGILFAWIALFLADLFELKKGVRISLVGGTIAGVIVSNMFNIGTFYVAHLATIMQVYVVLLIISIIVGVGYYIHEKRRSKNKTT